MIKKAKVISQKPSYARKNLYITALDDGAGELKAYSTRRLQPGEEVTISIKQGAMRDPLDVTILTEKQAASVTPEHKVEVKHKSPELSAEAVEELVKAALDSVSDGYDYINNDTMCFWLLKNFYSETVNSIKKRIYNKAKQLGYDTDSSGDLLLSVDDRDFKVRVVVSIPEDGFDKRVVVELYEEI